MAKAKEFVMLDGAIWYPDLHFTVYPPKMVSLAECARCGFTFDAIHFDENCQYNCPKCPCEVLATFDDYLP